MSLRATLNSRDCAALKNVMKQILFFIFLFGLISCSPNSQEKKVVDKESTDESVPETTSIEQTRDYREIILSENKIDIFSIPFPEKNVLRELKDYYEPYWVEANIGQQDGPDFTYFEIARDDENPIAYFDFDSENEFKLEEIRIVSSVAKDQYGVRVGDTYQQVISKRQIEFKNSTDYHQHTYLYSASSNIYYEISGFENYVDIMIENIEELILDTNDLKHCKVDAIIWRKRK